MAEQSPAKKRKMVKGHLFNVSPLKDTEKPYFEAILQDESEFFNIVVYKPEEHTHFQNAEKVR